MSTIVKYRTSMLRDLYFDFEGTAWRGKNPRMDFGAWLERHDRAADVWFSRDRLGTVVALGQSWYLWQLADGTDSGSTSNAEEALLILWYGTRNTAGWLYA